MASNDSDAETVDALPEDPMQMPPPYWRASGAIFHINSSLHDLERRLKRLPAVLEKNERGAQDFYARHPTEAAWEKAKDEWYDIFWPVFRIEHSIKLSAQVACLMSAIKAEDCVNCFCVYNLPKHVAEGIEKLSLTEKLVIACTLVGCSEIKGLKVYEGVKKLVSWRNAFAHGHCVDRPTKSLRHNHLISPPEHPGVPSSVREVKAMVGAYLSLADHLRSVSKNPYTGGKSVDDEEIRRALKRIDAFVIQGSNREYSIQHHPPRRAKGSAQQSAARDRVKKRGA